MSHRFKVGDIVKLKSGGPVMTVTSIVPGERGLVRTSWFAGSKNERDAFPTDALVLIEDGKQD
jgi:uncharacterized protein YodC (DUF2158 family)